MLRELGNSLQQVVLDKQHNVIAMIAFIGSANVPRLVGFE